MIDVHAFDRDGVLLGSPTDFQANNPRHLNLENISEKLNRPVLESITGPAIIISNQGGIAGTKRYKSLQDVQAEMLHLMEVQPYITAAFFCPDEGYTCYWLELTTSSQSICGMFVNPKDPVYRKPRAGMFAAAKERGYRILSYTGDLSGRPEYADGRDGDLRAAQNAGVPYCDVWSLLC